MPTRAPTPCVVCRTSQCKPCFIRNKHADIVRPTVIMGNVEVKVWFVQYVEQRAKRAHTALVCAARAHTRGIK